MKKEELIKKWLDNELSVEELKAFQRLEEYDSYVKLSEKAKQFKAPDFDSSEAYKRMEPIIEHKRTQKSLLIRLRPIAQIAAIFMIVFGAYTLLFSNGLTTFNTLASQKITITLPDASIVKLNSKSQLSFDKNTWKEQREVKLEGEAFFKVAKGSRFDVQTNSGIVSVMGTQFNVKNRNNYFEVKCFEGKVSVLYRDELTELPAGKTLRIINGITFNNQTNLEHPTWIENESSFKSVPLAEVIDEFERQYDVKVVIDIDTNTLFSGSFVHDNKDLALKSITLPFGLNYTIENKIITFKKIE